MVQVALAPCSPFSVTKSLMEKSAGLAERHAHASTPISARRRTRNRFCLERFQCRPVDYLEEVGWLGRRTWLAHGIHFTSEECRRLGAHKVGVCHCPTSNAVLASGFCPTAELEAAGSPARLGVDGSASNDSSNMMEAVRHALMVNRLSRGSASAVTARDAIRWGTEGRRPASDAPISAASRSGCRPTSRCSRWTSCAFPARTTRSPRSSCAGPRARTG